MNKIVIKILHATSLLLLLTLASSCRSASPKPFDGTECEGDDCLLPDTDSESDSVCKGEACHDPDTDSSTDTDTDTDGDGDTDTDTDGDADTDGDGDADTDGDGDGDTDGDGDADTDGDGDADTDGDGDADTDGDGDADTDGDGDTDTDTDADADADTDTDTDADTDTGTEPEIDTLSELDSNSDGYVDGDTENTCPDGQHEGCYNNSAWCLDATEEPITPLQECTNGERCVPTSENAAICICMPHASYQCYAGDVWAYDSCGGFDGRQDTCTENAPCTAIDDSHAACCEQNVRRNCGLDGNIHYFDACGMEGDIAEECDAEAHLACRSISANEAECGCSNHWEGENCDVCPGNWNPDKDCNECYGYWTGDNCEVCEGFGDLCQCPDDTFVPHPTERSCWTCPLPNKAENGVCPEIMGDTFDNQELLTACPVEFRIPGVQDVATVLDNCSEIATDEKIYTCNRCDFSDACTSMYGNISNSETNQLADFWIDVKCDEEHYQTADMSTGVGSYGIDECDETRSMVICVR